MTDPDAVVVGAGPNGLAAANILAEAGLSVQVLEAAAVAGGGLRSGETTLPGFIHDHCSTAHPLAAASPVLRALRLERHGLELLHADAPLAHPLDGGRAAVLERSVEDTAAGLEGDGAAYLRLMGPLVAVASSLVADLLGPLRPPRHPLAAARFGLTALRPASRTAAGTFEGEPARALFAGLAAHACLPLETPGTSAFALILGVLGHAVGWPVARGGSQAIAGALSSRLEGLGGTLVTGRRVESLDELPPGSTVLLDLTPREALRVAGRHLPDVYVRRLRRYRYGPGVFKVDWALNGPIPWLAEGCRRAVVVHLGGSLEEIAASERAVGSGLAAERPFVILAQQTLADPGRAPAGGHTGWAYCHVPAGSTVDMTPAIEAQVERFAPGFGERVLARRVTDPAAFERFNPNWVGGDINGGRQDLRQLYARPMLRRDPYATGNRRLWLCSSATPPGGGVHGLCGGFAARAALRSLGR